LLTALAGVATFNDVRAWTELLALPKMTLVASARGGRKHIARAEAETKRRCSEWLEGNRGGLWRSATSGTPQRGVGEMSQDRRHQRVRELLQDDLMQQACSALIQDPPVEVTDQVVNEMRAKHPAARAGERVRLDGLRDVAATAAVQADCDAVAKALTSFGKGSGPGPCGLRPQHLKDAMAPGLRDEVLRQMTAVVNLMARGEVPAEIQPWLCGASLAALPKPSGDLRPVAVGETWRRLAGKVLAKATVPELRSHFEPLQMGVGTSGGCEAIVHVVRQWLARNRHDVNRVLLTLDLKNAFNSVDRSACFERAAPHSAGTRPLGRLQLQNR